MDLLSSLVICAAAWAMLQFIMVPSINAWNGNALLRAGIKASLLYLRLLTFVMMVVYAGLVTSIKLLSVNVGWVIATSDLADYLHEKIEHYNSVWDIAFLLVLVAALLITASHRARKEESTFDQAYRLAEWQKIDDQRIAGTLPELEQTEELLAIAQGITEREALLSQKSEGEQAAEMSLQLTQELEALYRAYYMRDTLRRIPPRPKPESELKPTASSSSHRAAALRRLEDIVSSQGMITSGTTGSKYLHVALVMLLALSLVTVTATNAAATDLRREAVSLSQVDVARHHQEHEQEIQEALPAPTMTISRHLSAAEIAGIRKFSMAFAHALEHSVAVNASDVPTMHDVNDLHNAHIRAAILQQLQHDPRLGLASVRSLNEAAFATAMRIDNHDEIDSDPIARQAEGQLRQWLAHVPSAESRNYLAKLATSWSKPSDIDDISDSLTGEAFGKFYDAVVGNGHDEFIGQIREAVGEGLGDSLKTLVANAFDHFTTIAAQSGVASAATQITQVNSDVELDERGLLKPLHNKYANLAGWQRLIVETRAHPPAAPAREVNIPAWAVEQPPLQASGFATTFADIATAGYGDDLRSPRHHIEAADEASSGLSGDEPAKPWIPRVEDPVPPQLAQALSSVEAHGADVVLGENNLVGTVSDETVDLAGGFLRARSYALLTGFSRIGGVLIGAPPSVQRPVDCRNLTWDLSNDTITLHVSGPNCPWQSTAIDRTIFSRAMAYAADGRPVATTMVSSSPLLDGLSVHTHPALVDSQIGRESSKIDMFIDTYFRNSQDQSYVNKAYLTSANEIDSQIALYHVALALREQTLAARLSNRIPADFVRQLDDDAAAILSKNNEQLVQAALTSHHEIADTPALIRRSILRSKAAYFDPDLVSLVEACDDTNSQKHYTVCLQNKVNALDFSDDATLRSWLSARPIEYHLESGVREIPYDTPSVLHINDDITPSQQGIGPFRFELHVTFYSKPTFAKDEADALRQDAHPYDLPEIEPSLRARIVAVEKSHDDVKVTLHRMALFTRAQRFVRAALAGELGADFPNDRLTLLAQDLAAKPEPKVRTLRWLVNYEAYPDASITTYTKLLAIKNPLAVPIATKVAEGIHECTVAAIYDFRSTHRLVFSDPSCDFSRYTHDVAALASCAGPDCSTVRRGYALLQIMRLRYDLGVDVDDQDALTPMQFFPS